MVNIVKNRLIAEVEYPTGRYIVELFDDRGKLVDRSEASNYISTVWENHAKTSALMDLNLHGFPYNSGANVDYGNSFSPFPGRILHPMAHRPWPLQCVVLTGDTSAENSADHWLKGQMIGYAAMWKATVASSGLRGQINESQCTRSINANTWKWVWDWNTTQGNGIFQTAGMAAVTPSRNTYEVMCGPNAIRGPGISDIAAITGSVNTVYIGNGKIVIWGNESTGSPQNWRCYISNIPGGFYSTDVDGSGRILDAITGITWTAIGTTNPGGINRDASGGGAGIWTSAGATAATLGMHYDTTTGDIFFVEPYTNGSGRCVRMTTATGAQAWATVLFGGSGYATTGTPSSSVNYNGDVAVVGSKCYATCAGTNANATTKNKLLRLDVTTGSIDAVITLPGTLTSEGSITTDGTDLFLATNIGIVKLSVAGALLQVYGYPSGWIGTPEDETGVSPFTNGTINFNTVDGNIMNSSHGSTFRKGGDSPVFGEQYDYRKQLYSAAMGTVLTANQTYKKLQYHDNKLWINGKDTLFPSNKSNMIGVIGGNCFSRTLLSTPVTKSASNTMKVSYEITFPSWDSLWPNHLLP